jgi:hypothetical protein
MKTGALQAGTRLEVVAGGRVGSPGSVTSGRRWHRRTPDPWQGVHDPMRPLSSSAQLEPPRGGDMTRAHRLLVAILGAGLIAGCAARGVRVAELKDQPDKYARKTVSITGVVTSSVGTSLLPFQIYNIDDGSGEITVVSKTNRSPTKGSRVEVKGQLNEVAVFGGRSIGLHLQESSRKIKS